MCFKNFCCFFLLIWISSYLWGQDLKEAYKNAPKAPPISNDCCCTGECGCFSHNELYPYLWDSTAAALDYAEARKIGEDKLQQLIKEYMDYPEMARALEITGISYLRVVIDTTGWIDPNRIEVLRSSHPVLDKEAVQIIKKINQSYKWVPAKHLLPCQEEDKKELAVRCRLVLPIKFRLEE